MFKRKLLALDYHNPSGFKANDESEFRNMILWLEDQKIRHFAVEDRKGLRNICAGDWDKSFEVYLKELKCPLSGKDRNATLDWLLGCAIRLEYGDNVEKYKSATSESKGVSQTASSNPLDTLDVESPDFKAGVVSLSQLLQIPPHVDHILLLKAVTILVKERLSKEAIERHKQKGIPKVHSITLEKVDLGFETPDYISQEAAKILRLLHVRELRDLQNSINEAIVHVQKLTANPKTDTKLGKVGRS